LEEALAAWTEELNVKNGTTTDEAVKEIGHHTLAVFIA